MITLIILLLILFFVFSYIYGSKPIKDKLFDIYTDNEYLSIINNRKTNSDYNVNVSYQELQLAMQERVENHSFKTTYLEQPSRNNQRFLNSSDVRERAVELKNFKTFKKVMKFL